MERHAAPRGHATWLSSIVARVRRDVPLVILDLCVLFPAYFTSVVLRFEGRVPDRYWTSFWRFLPIVALVHLLSNRIFGLYGQMWRHASVHEARRVVLASVVGGLLVVALATIGRAVYVLPLSVLALGPVLSLLGFGAVRFQSRLFYHRRRTAPDQTKRVLLVGAGDAGSMVLKDILGNPSVGLVPVAVADDDPRKIGRSLHGVPIVGPRSLLPSLVDRLEAEQVLLAIPSATSGLVRDVASLCEEADVTLRVLPSVREIVGGPITARDIRDLQIEDVLGRQQVAIDVEAIGAILRGRRVLVTGAGGSIGSEIARQVSALDPSALVLVDHDETHLHDIVADLSASGVDAVLADIRDRGRMIELFMTRRPEVVFHAAAHKHVTLLEFYPDEAVLTNVIGTANVVDAAAAAGVERFVFVSTDKAVRPTSVMGATKWLAEQIVRSVSRSGRAFCAVRFGNVVGSRGSVIPTFLRQIANGGPVTVTDPLMARYFMSIEEAVQLVLQAGAISQDGEILTLDMGEPINILDLGRKLIRLSGRVPDRDIRIEIIGRRPGEKLVEELVDPDEEVVPSGHPGIVRSRPPTPDRPTLRRMIGDLETLVREGRSEELAERMRAFVEASLEPVAAGDAR